MEKKDLLADHTHFVAELARLEEEIAPVREKARELDAAIQAAKETINTDSVELHKADIDRTRSRFIRTDLRIEPAEFKQMQWALDDKKEQLETLLFQKKELSEHVNFLQEGINTVKRRTRNIRVTLSNELVKQQAALVARAAGQSLNDLIAALVTKIDQPHHVTGGALEQRRHLLACLGEEIYNQALINLDVPDFGIPRLPEAQQKVTAMIEAMGQDNA